MTTHWKNKYILVTGAGSGIGRALANHFAKLGANLIITDIIQDNLDETKASLASSVVISHKADVSSQQDWNQLAEKINKKIGHLDALINNAGMSPFDYFNDTPSALFDKVMAVNFNGAVMGCRTMEPLLEKSKRGIIANVASIFGVVTMPMMTSYHASKFALRGFTEALKQDYQYQNKNIDVVCILPGGIKTNIAVNAEENIKKDIDFAAHFSSIALTSADKAARVIEKGMRKKRLHILIGPDAKFVSWLQRLCPSSYPKIFNQLMGINKLVS